MDIVMILLSGFNRIKGLSGIMHSGFFACLSQGMQMDLLTGSRCGGTCLSDISVSVFPSLDCFANARAITRSLAAHLAHKSSFHIHIRHSVLPASGSSKRAWHEHRGDLVGSEPDRAPQHRLQHYEPSSDFQ